MAGEASRLRGTAVARGVVLDRNARGGRMRAGTARLVGTACFTGSNARAIPHVRWQPGRPFRVINGGNGLIADVSSPRMTADLARHGVVPRKSLTMEASQAAARRPEFWLGVFDGDGCCTFSKRGVPRIGILGSRPLMTQFAAWLHATFEDRRPAVGSVGRNGGHLSDVRVTGDRARRLAELMALDQRGEPRAQAGAIGARGAVRKQSSPGPTRCGSTEM